MHIFDSSVWVALFLNDDPHHLLAEQIYEQIDEFIHVPYPVVAEVATVLTYRHSKEQAKKFISFLHSEVRILLTDSMIEEDIKAFLHVSQRISFTDISVVHMAKRYNLTLMTFDKQQQALFDSLP